MDNINNNLESDLRQYCKTLDDTIFENKLLSPLTYLAKSICSKNKVNKQDYENNIVNDLVSTAATKLPDYYKENKGTCKAACYVIMHQYLCNRQLHDSKQKRDWKRVVYIEDIDNSDEHITHLIQVEIDDFKLMKQTLLEHRALFQRLKNKLHRKIANKIVEAIEKPELYSSNKNSFTEDIAKRCKTNTTNIYSVIGSMKKIIALIETQ